MKNYTLSKEKIAELEKLHRSLRDKRHADRVKAVIALSKGWSAAQLAEILLFDEKTSRHYFERYQQGGLKALLDVCGLVSVVWCLWSKLRFKIIGKYHIAGPWRCPGRRV